MKIKITGPKGCGKSFAAVVIAEALEDRYAEMGSKRRVYLNEERLKNASPKDIWIETSNEE